ncbi:MAG TPA: circadian clock KaiB family protein [Pyrinomonadaceae bacterium]|jgi:circadian clock protein KaiB|nr:circadian clock KaiB family protein [Pyrinomonadaceae bacterium]
MAKPKNGNGKTASKRPSKSRFLHATEAFEQALKEKAIKRATYILRLYVTGSSHRSLLAVYNLKKLCDEYLPDDYDLEVIDIYKDPSAAREAQIIAAPTLVKKLPQPIRKFVGDMSNTQKLLVGLDLYKRQENGEGLNGAELRT